jgi:Na+/H+ antiporter NhaD/arsenite permease-like protein
MISPLLANSVMPVAPSAVSAIPFAALLLSIAILPLIRRTEHFWHHNRNKLLVAGGFAVITLVYYALRGRGLFVEGHVTDAGLPTALTVLRHGLLDEYLPFMILLFSLYTISGGIVLRGDLRATPTVNMTFLGAGSLLASVVGTTGASMLLIRPLLQTNRDREHVRHTVIFFIFLVSNIGGCLLPVGDPPLFLGYLRGVPFLWTLQLWKEWALCTGILLTIYYIWDSRRYAQEPALDKMLDASHFEPLRLQGVLNFVWLLGVMLAVAFIRPGKPLLGAGPIVPQFLREAIMLAFVGLAWVTTPQSSREANSFDFGAIIEVAALFVGIFLTMQPPIEILHVKGPQLGLHSPQQFFWATGGLSSFLDNAPTYVVFFETANALTTAGGAGILKLAGGDFIREDLLIAISLGAVFMGANTYIGNGPNFMVKSIAEGSGVRMPSFFGYMAYSICILIPVFILVMLLL